MAAIPEMTIYPKDLMGREATLTVRVKVKFDWRVSLGLLLIRAGAWLAGMRSEVEHE
jgi:hypothetical protein